MSASGLNTVEKKAAFSLATVFGLRMLGLFMILPVFAIYGPELSGYSPIWLGLAIGAYGLTQALLQIPMGILSDKIGRKPVILGGLVVFAAGSVVAAMSDSIQGVVIGRALQGMGAIASAVLALAADLTREEQRPKVMATIGMFIGLSFTLALVLGPVVTQAYGLSGLFWFTGILTLFAMLMIQFMVPNSVHKAPKGDNVAMISQLSELARNKHLLPLNVGVFVLHMALTACFIFLPLRLVDSGLALSQHWQLYLPTLLGSFFLMVPFMIYGLKKQKEKEMFLASIVLLAVTLVLMAILPSETMLLVLLILAFFVAFNYLEATMPSMLSRIAPAGVKGSAMGIFSSSQFLGAFAGGAVGGWLAEVFNQETVFFAMSALVGLWFVVALGMKRHAKSKSFSFNASFASEEHASEVADKLVNMPGVIEATLVYSEAVAYLKLDDKQADIPQIKALLNP
ncbi:MFS transporter [Thalassotalea euphylliae]|uniref:MFS transporter n=1 Tax=Thalassotalea euphylliae TaxID=1655234 RepID=UPI003645C9A8